MNIFKIGVRVSHNICRRNFWIFCVDMIQVLQGTKIDYKDKYIQDHKALIN